MSQAYVSSYLVPTFVIPDPSQRTMTVLSVSSAKMPRVVTGRSRNRLTKARQASSRIYVSLGRLLRLPSRRGSRGHTLLDTGRPFVFNDVELKRHANSFRYGHRFVHSTYRVLKSYEYGTNDNAYGVTPWSEVLSR